MSWNKNTVVLSTVDSTIKTLENLGESYSLTTLGEVRGNGLNDFDGKTYPIRRLSYKNVVILEQMVETDDCDMDDYLMSFEFPNIAEPHDWLPIVSEANIEEFTEIMKNNNLENA